MQKIKLPFGLNENNILVHIADVERGLKCNCVCPDCKSKLVASKGSKKQPHFKHAVDNNCRGGFESAIHLAAKQIIKETKQITLAKYVSVVSGEDSKGKIHTEEKIIVQNGTIINFDSVQEEVDLHDIRADILAQKGKTQLIIEVFYRHKIDDLKRIKILKSDISTIEINLSDLKPEHIADWETFQAYVNDPKRVHWIHNAKAYDGYLECEKKLEKRIEEQEEKYQQEEQERQVREQNGKKKLAQALEFLKILSNEKSIAQLKQEAVTHPVWQDYSKYFRFSLNELPDYLNVDVPDGDWIFGCDRRIWQIAFYVCFINWKNPKPFCIKYVDDRLQNTIGLKVHESTKIIGILGNLYPQSIPSDVNRPSTWKTLRKYFNYLENLGMLQFSGDDDYKPGNIWFKVIRKTPN